MKTDGPRNPVRHHRIGWFAGWWCLDLRAYWLTQRVQLRAQGLMKRYAEREALYARFIVEASKRFADAWSHKAESPEVVAGLYSAIERMRLTSSDVFIIAAEGVMHNILEAYAQPDNSFDDLRAEVYEAIGFPIVS